MSLKAFIDHLYDGGPTERTAAEELDRLSRVLDGIAHTMTDDADSLRNMAAAAIYTVDERYNVEG